MYPPHNISQKNMLGQDGRSGPHCPYRVFHIAPYTGQNVFFQKRINFFTKSIIAIISAFGLFDLCLQP